jgi:hypothetical protein
VKGLKNSEFLHIVSGMIRLDEEVSYLLVKEGEVADMKVNILYTVYYIKYYCNEYKLTFQREDFTMISTAKSEITTMQYSTYIEVIRSSAERKHKFPKSINIFLSITLKLHVKIFHEDFRSEGQYS